MFELRADTPGPRPVFVTAWLGGSYLGELSSRSPQNATARPARTAMCSLR